MSVESCYNNKKSHEQRNFISAAHGSIVFYKGLPLH